MCKIIFLVVVFYTITIFSCDKSDDTKKPNETNADTSVPYEGKNVLLKDLVAKGSITIIDFYAEWCGGCMILLPQLEELPRKYENIVLRKVDLTDRREDLERILKTFGEEYVPYIRIYDSDGKLIKAFSVSKIEEVEEVIKPYVKERK